MSPHRVTAVIIAGCGVETLEDQSLVTLSRDCSGITGLFGKNRYRRSVAAAETLTSRLDCSDALQACGCCTCPPRWRPARRPTHLREASTLAARMDPPDQRNCENRIYRPQVLWGDPRPNAPSTHIG